MYMPPVAHKGGTGGVCISRRTEPEHRSGRRGTVINTLSICFENITPPVAGFEAKTKHPSTGYINLSCRIPQVKSPTNKQHKLLSIQTKTKNQQLLISFIKLHSNLQNQQKYDSLNVHKAPTAHPTLSLELSYPGNPSSNPQSAQIAQLCEFAGSCGTTRGVGVDGCGTIIKGWYHYGKGEGVLCWCGFEG